MRSRHGQPEQHPGRTGPPTAQAHRPAATSVTPTMSAETSGTRTSSGLATRAASTTSGGRWRRSARPSPPRGWPRDGPEPKYHRVWSEHAAVRHQAADQPHDRTREHRVVQRPLAGRGEVPRPPRARGPELCQVTGRSEKHPCQNWSGPFQPAATQCARWATPSATTKPEPRAAGAAAPARAALPGRGVAPERPADDLSWPPEAGVRRRGDRVYGAGMGRCRSPPPPLRHRLSAGPRRLPVAQARGLRRLLRLGSERRLRRLAGWSSWAAGRRALSSSGWMTSSCSSCWTCCSRSTRSWSLVGVGTLSSPTPARSGNSRTFWSLQGGPM